MKAGVQTLFCTLIRKIKNTMIMLKKESNQVPYVAPECTVYKIMSRGMLCQSVEGTTIQDLEYDDDDELGC